MPLVGLLAVTVVFPGHTHLLFGFVHTQYIIWVNQFAKMWAIKINIVNKNVFMNNKISLRLIHNAWINATELILPHKHVLSNSVLTDMPE